MGTISARKRANGTTSYTAQIRIKRDGKVIYSQAETFNRKQNAALWLRNREAELDVPGALERAIAERGNDRGATLGDAIDRYIEESAREIGKTKAQVLRAIKADRIADMACSRISSSDIVAYAQRLLSGDREPSTVGNYMSHLSAVFAIAKIAWKMELNPAEMKSAQMVLDRLGVTAKSKRRDRRPALTELDQLMTFFSDRKKTAPQSSPMHAIIAFAIYSTRRQEEIVSIRWEDYQKEHARVLVRDMKHPGQKIGNDVWCELTPEAIRIIEAQPRKKDRIFPYGTDAISAAFTRACKTLGIEDLRFHDLRHDGVSRLFEMGRSIPQAASVSGHRSWTSLQRYTHMRESGDKYQGWKWLDIVAGKEA